MMTVTQCILVGRDPFSLHVFGNLKIRVIDSITSVRKGESFKVLGPNYSNAATGPRFRPEQLENLRSFFD